ncbi:arsenate reductase ArsC [Magnetospirillum sulfuroxidans]|uniref:Arsenate reductase ArsC n=1 Tax=Magnetospirillum sulfuroxidans TaxID=611300 RepID=A0ABS5IH46_9PROT|nr:arsenate reductase ArsC [Magnetospirillum sulfuroxidans]MBR9973591.1 arsenate reductase ArsC [Magnetospirillum sulfuroxidans]
MLDNPFNVLFICRHNTARSQMAEALLSSISRRRFIAYSAGIEPRAEIHPLTLETIRNAGLRTDGLTPKGTEMFRGPEAPALDFAFTLCDGNESCPSALAGAPMLAHWPFPDPLEAEGTHAEKAAVFAEVFRMIRRRLELFVELPMERLDRLTLQRHVDGIGQSPSGV